MGSSSKKEKLDLLLPSTQDIPTTLCSACQTIKFDTLLPNAWLDVPEGTVGPGPRHQEWKSGIFVRHPTGSLEPRDIVYASERNKWDVGLLSDIISRADSCPFCRIIVRALQKREGTEDLPTEINGHPLPCRVYQEKIGDVQEEVGVCRFKVAVSGWHISRLRFACVSKAKGSYPYTGYAAPYAAQIGPSVRTMSLKSKIPPYMGRYRSLRCDTAMFKGWIDRCAGGHAFCSTSMKGPTNCPFRLIDVERNCLKTFPDANSLDIQYMTLSYVWGYGKKDFVLTKDNLTRYHETNSLGRLPKTIADAMDFVRMLGKQFLWVDALCIIQDDPQDHLIQIPAMKAIYGGSLLTVVAAFGDNAEAGLPGINTDRMDPMVADVGGYIVIESTGPLDPFHGSPVIQTTWNTRAWTFQEYLLSPRSIIFLEEQAYWRCRSAEWFEEMDFDAANLRFVWGNNNISGNTELTVANYGNLIEQYTKRKLTFDEDIYDAFSGILEAIPDDFFWGLPHSRFGDYLCWTEAWSVNRPVDDRGSIQWRNLKEAPSWSWMAWKGPIYPCAMTAPTHNPSSRATAIPTTPSSR